MLLFKTADGGSDAKSTAYDLLISRVAEGDRDAFKELYEAVSAGVYGLALSITKNTYDAEDVLQETLLTVYGKATEYVPQGKPLAWIYTIARNAALSKLRTAKRIVSLDAADPAVFSVDDNHDLRLTLQTVLSALGDDERQIISLHAAGLKHKETAAVTGLPLNTVLSKYHRALKKLKSSLKEARQ